MKIINLQYPNTYKNDHKNIVLAMGYFDGLHRGHQEVIKKAKQIADDTGRVLAVLTYRQSPASFYKSDQILNYPILPFEQKIEKFKAMGVQLLFAVDYSIEFGRQEPQTFVDNYLVSLGCKTVVAGFDHTYGPVNKKADMKHLPEFAKGRFEVVTVGQVSDRGGKISSTRIRSLLLRGKLELVNRLLGYDFQTVGQIVYGNQIGRKLGFPTINQELKTAQLLPKVGVYAVISEFLTGKYQKKSFMGMASIGYNETFGENNPLTLEINLFDFSDDVYGQMVKIKWISFLRDQVKFSSSQQLVNQLYQDRIKSKEILNGRL